MAKSLDDVYQADRSPMLDKLGGAGTYATMGARLFHPQESSITLDRPSNIGFVVHAGADFPMETEAKLKAWNTRSLFIRTPERLTTRGRNVYHDEVRGS